MPVKKKKLPAKNKLFRGLAALYGFCSLALIPWAARLSNILPHRSVSPHWHAAWIGLDIMLIAMLAMSALALIRRSAWAIMATSVVGAMLVIDAWFDLLTSHPGAEFSQAIVSAVGIEIPLAGLSFWIAARCIRDLDAIPRVRAHIRKRLKPSSYRRA